MTYGETLRFLAKVRNEMANWMGEDWGEHVQQLIDVIDDACEEEGLSKSDSFITTRRLVTHATGKPNLELGGSRPLCGAKPHAYTSTTYANCQRCLTILKKRP